MTLRNSRVLFLLVLLLWTAGIARADAVFNFNSDPVGPDFYGASTPFSNTDNGLTATFSSPAFAGGFAVALVPFFAPPFTGNMLYDPGRVPVSNIALDIAFSSNLTSISMDFATDAEGTGPFDLTAFLKGVAVGSVSATGTVPVGFQNPQGSISFGGVTFDSIELTAPNTPHFAIDNLDAVVATPEPNSFVLIGTGLLGLAVLAARKKRHAIETLC
jgi:hypothetical protein